MAELLDTTTTAQKLGFSVRHLHRLIEDGTFKNGVHFVDVRRKNAMRATYRWNLEKCKEALSVPVMRRK